jgi:hypothetical protein
MFQVHKWVRNVAHGTRFRATKHFRGIARHDCVRLKQEICAKTGESFDFARIMWIVSGVGEGPLCVVVPLMRAKSFTPQSQAQMELAAEMIILERCCVSLHVLEPSMLHRIEQVQFVGTSFTYGIVNCFYYSNIFSTKNAHDSSDSDD